MNILKFGKKIIVSSSGNLGNGMRTSGPPPPPTVFPFFRRVHHPECRVSKDLLSSPLLQNFSITDASNYGSLSSPRLRSECELPQMPSTLMTFIFKL